jgi:hypothetical protein
MRRNFWVCRKRVENYKQMSSSICSFTVLEILKLLKFSVAGELSFSLQLGLMSSELKGVAIIKFWINILLITTEKISRYLCTVCDYLYCSRLY